MAFRGPGPPCHAILVGARDLYHSRWMGHSGGSEVGGLPGRRNRELLAPQGPKVAQLRAGRPGKPIDRALQEASGSRTSMDRDCRCQKLANGEGEQVCGCVLSEEKYCAISPLVGLYSCANPIPLDAPPPAPECPPHSPAAAATAAALPFHLVARRKGSPSARACPHPNLAVPGPIGNWFSRRIVVFGGGAWVSDAPKLPHRTPQQVFSRGSSRGRVVWGRRRGRPRGGRAELTEQGREKLKG